MTKSSREYSGLLFGTELGKSVKDLTEASKVTSKV